MNRAIKQTRIVVAGGGFTGLYAARYLDKRMARRSDIEVTLVSHENFILFTPMRPQRIPSPEEQSCSKLESQCVLLSPLRLP